MIKALAAIGTMISGVGSDESCLPAVTASRNRRFSPRILWFLGALLLVLSGDVAGQTTTTINPVFQSGERLQYKVKWGFLRLGTITICARRDSSFPDHPFFKLTMVAESNPDLRVVWIWEYDESLMDAVALFSKRFVAKQINGDDGVQLRRDYDPERRIAAFSEQVLNSPASPVIDTLRNVPPFVEGPSLFYLTRCLARTRKVMTVPTFVNREISSTVLNFTEPDEDIEVDAFAYPVRAQKYTGTAQWKGGAAGLSGDFTGWLSDDEAAVLIKADLKVMLGSLHVELEQWTRPGWVPPPGMQASNRTQ